jgi:hypothetical protein
MSSRVSRQLVFNGRKLQAQGYEILCLVIGVAPKMRVGSRKIQAADFHDWPAETTLEKPDDFLEKLFVIKVQSS